MDIEAQRILPCSDNPTSRETGDEHGRFMRLFLTHEMEILRSVMVYVPQRSDARDILQEDNPNTSGLTSHLRAPGL